MQLSSSTASSDVNFAPFFAAGETPVRAVAGGQGLCAFEALLSGDSTPAPSAEKTAAGLVETVFAGIFSNQPPVDPVPVPAKEIISGADTTGETGMLPGEETNLLPAGVMQTPIVTAWRPSRGATGFAAAPVGLGPAVPPVADAEQNQGATVVTPIAGQNRANAPTSADAMIDADATSDDPKILVRAKTFTKESSQVTPPDGSACAFISTGPLPVADAHPTTPVQAKAHESSPSPVVPPASDVSPNTAAAAGETPRAAATPQVMANRPIPASDCESQNPVSAVRTAAPAPVNSEERVAGSPAPPPANSLTTIRPSPGTAARDESAVDNFCAPEIAPPPAASPVAPFSLSTAPVAAQNFAPADQGETFLGNRGAKFAVPDKNSGVGKISTSGPADKTFLNALEKRVTSGSSTLGIDVAKTSTAMPAPTLFDRPTTAAVSEHVTLAASSAAPVESSASVAAPVASDAGGAAHRAVDAVLTAVDRFSAGDRHAVNLHFSVAGADLDVRVELRANEVRTVFRTDSPELRAALAHEWRAENGDAADRSVRLAPPVFASGDSASHGSFSDGGASHHRDSGAQHLANENFESLASRARAGGPAMPATSGFTPAVSHIAAPATTLHLHALA